MNQYMRQIFLISIICVSSYLCKQQQQQQYHEPKFCDQYIYIQGDIGRQSICSKCIGLKVLSSDYSECIDLREELGILKLGNCIRLQEDGKCAEALSGLQIIKDDFSYAQSVNVSEKCSWTTADNQCLYPRLGYVLDVVNQDIYHHNYLFLQGCALFDSQINQCLQYFPGFYPDANKGLTRFLFAFINKMKIDYLRSDDQQIRCSAGYIFIGNMENPIGCLKNIRKNENNPIRNCIEHEHNYVMCKKCAKGYSLHRGRQICKNIQIERCEEYEEIEGIAMCRRCEKFYKVKFGQCQLMNCKMVDEFNQNICTYCESPLVLEIWHNTCYDAHTDPKENCAIPLDQNDCYKCKDNAQLYSSQSGYCTKREFSQMCEKPDPRSDTCLTLSCLSNDYFIELDKFLYHYFDFPNGEEYLQELKDQNQLLYSKCIFRKIIDTNCQKYHPLLDSCIECKSGYFLKEVEKIRQNAFFQTNLFKSKCVIKNPKSNPESIENCLIESFDGQFCVRCQIGFLEAGNNCNKGIQNCQMHSLMQFSSPIEYVCMKCLPGYIRHHRQCVKNTKSIVEPYCEDMTIHGFCKKCIKEFTRLPTGECIPISYKSIGSKEKSYCASLYQIKGNYDCLVNVGDEYYIDQLTKYMFGTSDKVKLSLCSIQNCQWCENNRCLRCKTGYAFDKNKSCQVICNQNQSEHHGCVQVTLEIEENQDLETNQENDNHNNKETEDHNKENEDQNKEPKDKNKETDPPNKETEDQNKETEDHNKETEDTNKDSETSKNEEEVETGNGGNEQSNSGIIFFIIGIIIFIALLISYKSWLPKLKMLFSLQGQGQGLNYNQEISEIE